VRGLDDLEHLARVVGDLEQLQLLGPMLPSASIVSFIQPSRPFQYALPTSTIGNLVILPVASRVSASNSSSIVPKAPGSTTNACEYLTKTVLRTKKRRFLFAR
jgi:hypothetical protein